MANLTSLLSRTSLDDHEEILAAAESTLKSSKSDTTAQHAQVVALLKLDRYDEALKAFEVGGSSLQSRAKVEYAYALYKSGRLAEARKVADVSNEQATAELKYVAAQIAYRSEDFATAASIYEDLAGTTSDSNRSADIRINAGACDAQLLWQGKSHFVRKLKADATDLLLFETVYNQACAYIARGQLKQADFFLKKAVDMCNASTELSEEDKKAEILPMKVQMIYVYSKQGRQTDAELVLSSLNLKDITDPVTRHIGQVNGLAASSAPRNPYLAQRLFEAHAELPANDLPFTHQSAALRRTAAALDLLSGKLSGVTKSSQRAIVSLPAASEEAVSAGVLLAASKTQNSPPKAALKTVSALLDRRPTDIGLALTLVQLHASSNNLQAATQTLESLLQALSAADSLDARFAPGLVATQVALYAAQHRHADSKAALASAAAHWRSRPSAPPSLLKAAGAALLDQPTESDLQAARETFDAARAADASDPFAAAGLVAASLDGAGLAADLPSVAELTKGLDAAALAAQGVPTLPSAQPAATAAGKKRPAPAAPSANDPTAPPSGKKLRASRTPKEFDPAKKPDPERWLPMRDRSYYRPKKGKKKGAASQGAAQGGVEAPASAPVVASTGGGGGGGGKGKKKKGKK